MTVADGVDRDGLARFERHRGRLFGIAYRMLGSATEAEDILQDAFVRWHTADHGAIESDGAWLATTVTRLCLNHLDSARVQREVYPGPWLPEPLPDGELGPLDTAAQRESVSLALLHVLETLTPPERASFVLREAFGYSHREIADVLEVSEANARQLYSRARAATLQRERRSAEPAAWHALVERFLVAARSGDLAQLESLLAADATAWSDGGGAVRAARRPVHGRSDVARYLIGVAEKFASGMQPTIIELNGELAVAGVENGQVRAVLFIDLDTDSTISGVRSVLNPSKLERIGDVVRCDAD